MGSQVLAQLMEKTKSCASAGDLQALMEAEGVWLNDEAARQAFLALESERRRAVALSDADLAGAVGGIGLPGAPLAEGELLDPKQAEGILLGLCEMMCLRPGTPTQMV